MLYPVCPTCGHLLADIEVEFTDKYEKINESKDSSYFNHIKTIL